MTLDDLYEDFDWLGDDMARVRYIMDLGKDVPPLPDADKNDTTLVSGCTSLVWMIHEITDDRPPKIRFSIDADAHIVKGLAAILMVGMSEKPARDILDFDVGEVFERLKLRKHLTPSRQNGVMAMANRMKAVAQAIVDAGAVEG